MDGYGNFDKARTVMDEGSNLVERFDKTYYPCMIEFYSRNYQKALSIPSGVTKWRLKLDPRFDPFRRHVRFKKLIYLN
jgi:hypothetical protein